MVHPLTAAADLVSVYSKTLNRKSAVCPHCTRETWESFIDHQEEIQLNAIVEKLRRLAAKKGTIQ